jgi:hypothetical protein
MSKQQTIKNIMISAIALLIVVATTACTESGQMPQSTKTVAKLTPVLPEITVYKSPTCSCCDDWITHLKTEGFTVITQNKDDMDSIKASLGITPRLASCHTATIEGYAIEGHVPAADIKRLLIEKPQIAGLTAPGMPMHSPGMQPPDEKPRDYDVLAFDNAGGIKLFTRY